MRAGTLDSETLSLQTNAVVYEVTLLTFDCDDAYNVVGTSQLQTWRLEILGQVTKGRHIDPATVEWGFGFHGSKFPELVCGELLMRVDVTQFLNELRASTKDLEELWINKASFDSGILHSLAEDYGIKGGLWPHKAELDLRVLYRKLPLECEKPTMGLHTSVGDCMNNLATLQAFGRFMYPAVKDM